MLAVFLLYTSIAGGGNPSLAPSELAGRTGTVQLAGVVVGPVHGDAHAGGLRFGLKDIGSKATTTVAVRYTGSSATAAILLGEQWTVRPARELLERLGQIVGRDGVELVYAPRVEA